LLAYEFSVPIVGADMLTGWYAIRDILPHLVLYFLSFITIAIMWENHHAIASKIGNMNQKIFWSNAFLLMFLALVPFATSFLGKNPSNKIALIFYCAIMLMISFCFSKFRQYVFRNIDNGGIKLKTPRHVGVYIYSFAIFTAFFSMPLAYLLLAIPLIFYLFPQQMVR
jgi:uncharacterized membrane protein